MLDPILSPILGSGDTCENTDKAPPDFICSRDTGFIKSAIKRINICEVFSSLDGHSVQLLFYFFAMVVFNIWSTARKLAVRPRSTSLARPVAARYPRPNAGRISSAADRQHCAGAASVRRPRRRTLKASAQA